jgi:hypothetical protein
VSLVYEVCRLDVPRTAIACVRGFECSSGFVLGSVALHMQPTCPARFTLLLCGALLPSLLLCGAGSVGSTCRDGVPSVRVSGRGR